MIDKKNKYWQFTKKFVLNPLKWALIIVLFFFVSTLIILRIPYFQTKIAQYASQKVSETLQHKVTIGHLDLNWIDNLSLKQVVIYDVEDLKMISVDEVEADFELKTIYTPYKIFIENVTLKNADVIMKNIGSTSNINISHFADVILQLTKSPNPNKKKRYTSFNIDKVTLQNNSFSFDDNTEPFRSKGFDNYHFGFKHINGDVSGFRLIADTLDIAVHKLNGIEGKTKLEICEISTFLRITDNSISLQKLDAMIGNSIIKDSLVMKFNSYRDFNDFNHKINITGNLKECSFHTKDLAIFHESLADFDDYWQVDGRLKGTVDRFTLKNSILKFGAESYFRGNLSFDGLPEFWETYFDLRLKDSYLTRADIRQYSAAGFDKILAKMKYVKAKGSIIGFPTDFVTSAKYQSAIGKWDTDLNIKIDSEKGVKLFKGEIATYGLDLGKLTNNEKRVQEINLLGYVEGNGLDPELSEVKLKAHIDDVSIENRIIRNIDTDALWSKNKFSGFIDVKDSNVVLTASGYFDLSDHVNNFKLDGVIKKIDLKALKVTNTQTTLSTAAHLNFKGLEIDELIGNIELKDFLIEHEGKKLALNNILIDASKSDIEHEFILRSDVVNFVAKGDFLFSTITDELKMLYDEYYDYYVNKKDYTTKLYNYKKKTHKSVDQNVKFAVYLKDFNRFTNLVMPELQVPKNVKIEGEFDVGEEYTFDLKSEISNLKYKKHEFENIDIIIKSSKPVFNDLIRNHTVLGFKNYKYKGVGILDSVGMVANWLDDSLRFRVDVVQAKNNIDIALNGLFSFDKIKSSSSIHVDAEKINILSQAWQLDTKNQITLSGNDFHFENLGLVSDSQRVYIGGYLSKDKNKPLLTDIRKLELSVFDPFISFDLGGVADAGLKISNLYENGIVNGNLSIKDLSIDKVMYGDLVGSASWGNNSEYLDLNIDLLKNQKRVVHIQGQIFPEADEQLHLKGIFNNTDIAIVEPMFDGVMSNMSGFANGELKIRGSFMKPLVLGRLKVNSGMFKVDYLNTSYKFDDYVEFTKDMIGVTSAKVYDNNKNQAIVNGGVYHDYFTDYRLNIKIESDFINVMNTSIKDNDIYFGEAYVSGQLKISGPFNDIYIEGDLTSLENTKLHIPIGGISKVSRENYISFVNKKEISSDSSENIRRKKTTKTSGIKMKLNLFLTPQAYNEIIFDQKSGDIIRGTGNGKITLEIDTKGDFNMYGDYVFEDGRYNFTMLNVINKDFEIKRGSKITWIGDPYGGRLDVKAIYEQQASLLPVAQGNIRGSQDSLLLKRRYPCVVNLRLTGDLKSPDVGLGIDIKQTPPDLNIFVQDFKTKIATNEQELNKQVFSLVMLGRFSEESSLSGSTLISSSLGEFFSNQLTSWMSQVDEDLQVDIDLNTVGADGLNAIRLRLSRVFLDNRLRVSVEDGFANTGKNNPNASAAGLAGNWTVEYMILKNGVVRAKIYNRTTQVANVNNNTITNTSVGVSILHTKDFDKFLELLNLKTKEENESQENSVEKRPDVIQRKNDEEL